MERLRTNKRKFNTDFALAAQLNELTTKHFGEHDFCTLTECFELAWAAIRDKVKQPHAHAFLNDALVHVNELSYDSDIMWLIENCVTYSLMAWDWRMPQWFARMTTAVLPNYKATTPDLVMHQFVLHCLNDQSIRASKIENVFARLIELFGRDALLVVDIPLRKRLIKDHALWHLLFIFSCDAHTESCKCAVRLCTIHIILAIACALAANRVSEYRIHEFVVHCISLLVQSDPDNCATLLSQVATFRQSKNAYVDGSCSTATAHECKQLANIISSAVIAIGVNVCDNHDRGFLAMWIRERDYESVDVFDAVFTKLAKPSHAYDFTKPDDTGHTIAMTIARRCQSWCDAGTIDVYVHHLRVVFENTHQFDIQSKTDLVEWIIRDLCTNHVVLDACFDWLTTELTACAFADWFVRFFTKPFMVQHGAESVIRKYSVRSWIAICTSHRINSLCCIQLSALLSFYRDHMQILNYEINDLRQCLFALDVNCIDKVLINPSAAAFMLMADFASSVVLLNATTSQRSRVLYAIRNKVIDAYADIKSGGMKAAYRDAYSKCINTVSSLIV